MAIYFFYLSWVRTSSFHTQFGIEQDRSLQNTSSRIIERLSLCRESLKAQARDFCQGALPPRHTLRMAQ